MKLGVRKDERANIRYILNRIIGLEAEKQGAVALLRRARGDLALQLRAHVVVLERQLRWYRGRLEQQNRASGATRLQERDFVRASRKPLVGAIRVNPGAVRTPHPTLHNTYVGRRPQDVAWLEEYEE